MAAFQQHLAFSTAAGAAYGTLAYLGLGLDVESCIVAAGLTGFAGMLPDLDSPTGQPVREVTGFLAAISPLILFTQIQRMVGTPAAVPGREFSDPMMLIGMTATYLAVRFGGVWLLDLLTVHRGMLHSVPAASISALVVFLLSAGTHPLFRLVLSAGVLIGFLSHLLLDEIWSVEWSAGRVQWKKSAGTAIKFFSPSIPATCTTYAILLVLTYFTVQDDTIGSWLQKHGGDGQVRMIATEVIDGIRR